MGKRWDPGLKQRPGGPILFDVSGIVRGLSGPRLYFTPLDASGSLLEALRPVFDASGTLLEASSPMSETSGPLFDASGSRLEASSPLVESSGPPTSSPSRLPPNWSGPGGRMSCTVLK